MLVFVRRVGQVGVIALIGIAAVAGLALATGVLPAPWQNLAKAKSTPEAGPSAPRIRLVDGVPHTLAVPEDVRRALGIRKGDTDLVAVARKPANSQTLEMPGSTGLDPTRLARIRARFAPCRVVAIGPIHDFSPKTGRSEFRELQPGDGVHKGDILGVFYSVDVGSKKNDLLDGLVQLELDQKILDEAEKHREAVPEVFLPEAPLLPGERVLQSGAGELKAALMALESEGEKAEP